MKDNNYEAGLRRLKLIVNKVSKENLKPRKGDEHKLQFIQCNMQKSQHIVSVVFGITNDTFFMFSLNLSQFALCHTQTLGIVTWSCLKENSKVL